VVFSVVITKLPRVMLPPINIIIHCIVQKIDDKDGHCSLLVMNILRDDETSEQSAKQCGRPNN